MEVWLKAALDYLPRWLEFQMRQSGQPGCGLAVAHNGRIVLDRAFGHADLNRRRRLTPRHRFRIASHSKSFTAAAILKLREQGRLGLDDPAGRYVEGLHPEIAAATIQQLLSHGAGVIRDGEDAGQWLDRRPFASARELRAALAAPPTIPANTRFKYSNHAFGLAGLIVEAVTGEPYVNWMQREIVAPAGLKETAPDGPPARGTPLARGHSSLLPLGRRVRIPGDAATHALAPATGFIASAADLARWFASLNPDAARSVLSPASRREMLRPRWRLPDQAMDQQYGLGVTVERTGDWDRFGHGGGFQSCLSRTTTIPTVGLTVSILTNATDGMANNWLDGAVGILRAFHQHGGAGARSRTRPWAGRWWSLWRVIDLVPMRNRVLVAAPAMQHPFADATEIEIEARDRGRIVFDGGYGSHGQPAMLRRTRNGQVREVQIGGNAYRTEARVKAELKRRYG